MKNFRRGLLTLLVMVLITSGAVFAQDDSPPSVGILATSQLALQPVFEGFLQGMTDQGYVEDETVTFIEFEPLAEDMDDEVVAEIQAMLEESDLDLLLVATDWDAQLVTDLIGNPVPIVVCFSGDLVGLGLAESLTQPGGHVTGIDNADYHARGLQILLEIDPTIQTVYVPYSLPTRESVAALESLAEVAAESEIQLITESFTDTAEVVAAISALPDDIDGIYLTPDRLLLRPEMFLLWVQTTAQRKIALTIPAAVRVPGVLMGYGPDMFANGQQAAGMVDRILRGADPATLPVENAEFFLMVNLQTAEAIEIEVPRSILRQAQIILRPGDLDDAENSETASGD